MKEIQDCEYQRLWHEVLRLWFQISMKRDEDVEMIGAFKNDVLEFLGIPKRDWGCPFCHFFRETKDCPLGNCSDIGLPCLYGDFSYGEWEKNAHNQKLAQKFFLELWDLYVKEWKL